VEETLPASMGVRHFTLCWFSVKWRAGANR
jgi:hypothetical protein